jgi:hypothetical protein
MELLAEKNIFDAVANNGTKLQHFFKVTFKLVHRHFVEKKYFNAITGRSPQKIVNAFFAEKNKLTDPKSLYPPTKSNGYCLRYTTGSLRPMYAMTWSVL